MESCTLIRLAGRQVDIISACLTIGTTQAILSFAVTKQGAGEEAKENYGEAKKRSAHRDDRSG